MGWKQSLSMPGTDDQLVRNAISDYATENFELACYAAIMELARELDDQETIAMAETIMEQEREMAMWLYESMPEAVRSELVKDFR